MQPDNRSRPESAASTSTSAEGAASTRAESVGEKARFGVRQGVLQRDLRAPALWAHLHALTVLASAGSFTAAAQRLGLSKAAMSQRVAELERAAGLPLVRRTTRSVRLTEAGQQLADAVQGAFATIDQAFTGVRDLAGEPRGLLRVTAPVALARQQIVPLLPEFLRRHPELRLELDLSDRLSPLAQDGFDLALRHTSTPPDTHVATALCATDTVLVASPAYLAARGLPQTPAELADHACLHYPRTGATPLWSFEPRRMAAQPVAAGKAARKRGARRTPAAAANAPVADPLDAPVSIAIRGPLAANNSEALRDAALGDLGIALLPDFSAQAALRDGALRRVLADWRPVGAFGSHLWAIRPHTAQVPRAVQALVAWLSQSLRGGFGGGA